MSEPEDPVAKKEAVVSNLQKELISILTEDKDLVSDSIYQMAQQIDKLSSIFSLLPTTLLSSTAVSLKNLNEIELDKCLEKLNQAKMRAPNLDTNVFDPEIEPHDIKTTDDKQDELTRNDQHYTSTSNADFTDIQPVYRSLHSHLEESQHSKEEIQNEEQEANWKTDYDHEHLLETIDIEMLIVQGVTPSLAVSQLELEPANANGDSSLHYRASLLSRFKLLSQSESCAAPDHVKEVVVGIFKIRSQLPKMSDNFLIGLLSDLCNVDFERLSNDFEELQSSIQEQANMSVPASHLQQVNFSNTYI